MTKGQIDFGSEEPNYQKKDRGTEIKTDRYRRRNANLPRQLVRLRVHRQTYRLTERKKIKTDKEAKEKKGSLQIIRRTYKATDLQTQIYLINEIMIETYESAETPPSRSAFLVDVKREQNLLFLVCHYVPFKSSTTWIV